jgi:hypothetical protein
MPVQPLRDGRESIAAQAARRGVDVPVGSTVEELRNMGYDVDPDWPLCAVVEANSDSPTGYCVKFPQVSFNDGYALAY